MKQIFLTLMVIANLIIATQAQTQSNVSQGAVTGSAQSSDGTFTVYHSAPVVSVSVADQLYLEMKARFTAAIDDMEIPAVSRPNGLVTRPASSTKEYNHDGKAFEGLNEKFAALAVAHAEEIKTAFTFNREQMTDSDAAIPNGDYARNIKSGKWHKFVNGE